MHSIRSFCLLLLILPGAFPPLSFAQYEQTLTFGGAGNENGRHLLSDDNGGFFLSGLFDAPFAPAEAPLPVFGEEDIFLGHLDGQGNWLWVKSGGSFLEDEIRVFCRIPGGDLLLAGTFWLDFFYEGHQLSTSDNIKGIFVIRLDSLGNWQWGKVINGSDLKEIADAKVAADGTIYLTGHFSGGLQFDTLGLEASGKNDAFLLRLDPDGRLLSWQQLGYKGTTRGQAIALHPEGGYFWGGRYDDTLQVDTATLFANTFDADVFLVRYDDKGAPIWARRAGGVHGEDLVAMTTDQDGQLLATGFLIGVMNLSDSLSIQSRNGNPDIFLFKYSDEGDVRWARAIGGELIDQPASLLLKEGQLIIGGTYYGQMAWDDLSTPATGGVNGFTAGFDPADGQSKWLTAIPTESFAFVNAICLDDQGALRVLGSFRDSALAGDLTIFSPGNYDVFLTGLAKAVTPVRKLELSLPVRVFPNPARHKVHLTGLTGRPDFIRFYDARGQLVREMVAPETPAVIDLYGLPSGVYWILVRQGLYSARLPVIISR